VVGRDDFWTCVAAGGLRFSVNCSCFMVSSRSVVAAVVVVVAVAVVELVLVLVALDNCSVVVSSPKARYFSLVVQSDRPSNKMEELVLANGTVLPVSSCGAMTSLLIVLPVASKAVVVGMHGWCWSS
jgi:hypothetical protein